MWTYALVSTLQLHIYKGGQVCGQRTMVVRPMGMEFCLTHPRLTFHENRDSYIFFALFVRHVWTCKGSWVPLRDFYRPIFKSSFSSHTPEPTVQLLLQERPWAAWRSIAKVHSHSTNETTIVGPNTEGGGRALFGPYGRGLL